MRGSELTVTFADGKITVKDATVTAADVNTSNGVIHIVDEVLLPPSDLADTVDTAVAAGKYTGCCIDKDRTGGCTERWWHFHCARTNR